MKLIVGLGNPGSKYRNNRHNVGFMIVDIFAIEMGLSWRYSKDWICHFSKTTDYVLVKPSTYMNASGESVAAVSEYFGVVSRDILVVHDDLDLEFGKIRLSFDGSSAGHRGVESVIKSLATPDFNRIRIGIGRPLKGRKGEDYVLSDFTKVERAKLKKVILSAIEAINSYLSDGIDATM